MMKRAILLISVLVSVVFSANSFAIPLPNSSYDYTFNNGRSYYNTGVLIGHVDYAVFDTSVADELADALGDTADGDGRFIYAYQVTNYSSSINAAAIFSILGISGDAIADSSTDMDSLDGDPGDPSNAGKKPTKDYFTQSNSSASWVFDDETLSFDGQDYSIGAGEKSFFLTIRSDYAPTIGAFSLVGVATDDIILPGETSSPTNVSVVNIPEPATISLLGIGGSFLMAARRRKTK